MSEIKTKMLVSVIKFYILRTYKKVVLCGNRYSDIYEQIQALRISPNIRYREISQRLIKRVIKNEAFSN